MIRRACLAAWWLGVVPFALADDPPQPAAAKHDAKPASRAPAPPPRPPIDAELLRSLENKTAANAADEPPLARIADRMRDVQARLTKADPGEETREIQADIVHDIDKLLEEIKKGDGKNSKQSGAKRSTSGSAGQQQGQQQPGSSQPAKDSNPNRGPMVARPANVDPSKAAPNGRTARAVWGHLPDKLKEEMQQSFKEFVLPKYEEMIEQYFRTIAEQNDKNRSL
jgi:hypothetical protein